MYEQVRHEAIWTANGQDHLVVVTSYLGKGSDGKQYVAIEGSLTGVPLDKLRFIDPDDPHNPFTSVWIDCHGRIHFAE